MSTAALHRISTLRAFGGACVMCAATSLLAACGGTSSTQPPASQPARVTPAASGADVGSLPIQTNTGQRTGSGAEVTSGQVGKVAAGRQTPTASNDDKRENAAANTFNPCTLVTLSEARSITGGTIWGRAEAPLGPTCIYKRTGTPHEITLAIEPLKFAQATHQLARRHGVVVNGRKGSCGHMGSQMLLVELPANQTLNVVAPCGVAQRFAAAAVNRLRAEG